jgi:hypothetical protein
MALFSSGRPRSGCFPLKTLFADGGYQRKRLHKLCKISRLKSSGGLIGSADLCSRAGLSGTPSLASIAADASSEEAIVRASPHAAHCRRPGDNPEARQRILLRTEKGASRRLLIMIRGRKYPIRIWKRLTTERVGVVYVLVSIRSSLVRNVLLTVVTIGMIESIQYLPGMRLRAYPALSSCFGCHED